MLRGRFADYCNIAVIGYNKDKTRNKGRGMDGEDLSIVGGSLRFKNFIANNCFTVLVGHMTNKELELKHATKVPSQT